MATLMHGRSAALGSSRVLAWPSSSSPSVRSVGSRVDLRDGVCLEALQTVLKPLQWCRSSIR